MVATVKTLPQSTTSVTPTSFSRRAGKSSVSMALSLKVTRSVEYPWVSSAPSIRRGKSVVDVELLVEELLVEEVVLVTVVVDEVELVVVLDT